jgi:hypothetical protein
MLKNYAKFCSLASEDGEANHSGEDGAARWGGEDGEANLGGEVGRRKLRKAAVMGRTEEEEGWQSHCSPNNT